MARGAGTAGRAVKKQARRAAKPQRAPKTARRSALSIHDLAQQLGEALAREAASAEVLNAIADSPGELKPVFDAILANAVRICEAKFGILLELDGDAYRCTALHNAPQVYADFLRAAHIARALKRPLAAF
jgi:hypothetical protein